MITLVLFLTIKSLLLLEKRTYTFSSFLPLEGGGLRWG